MKRRMWLAALAGLLMTAAAGIAADDPNMGTWKLDEAKSKITAGTPKKYHGGVRSVRRQHQGDHRRRGRGW